MDFADPSLNRLVPLLFDAADREGDALGTGGLRVVEVRHTPSHSIERTSQVVQGIAEIKRPLMLRDPTRDSCNEVDGLAIIAQNPIHGHRRAGVPLSEFRL